MRVKERLTCDNCSTDQFHRMQSGAIKVYVFHPQHGERQHACSVDCHAALFKRWQFGITRHWRQWARPPEIEPKKALSIERPTLVAL